MYFSVLLALGNIFCALSFLCKFIQLDVDFCTQTSADLSEFYLQDLSFFYLITKVPSVLKLNCHQRQLKIANSNHHLQE